MKTNIPLYRAKKIDSDEYLIGFLLEDDKNMAYYIIQDSMVYWLMEDGLNYDDYEIDALTLAIHFPDMLANDSDRLLPSGDEDLRIFASLSEDGKGGDILVYPKWVGWEMPQNIIRCVFSNKGADFRTDDNIKFNLSASDLKIVGIKQ